MAQTVPYLTEQQVRDKYAKALADYTKQRNTEADRERASVNSNYDNTQRQNYVQGSAVAVLLRLLLFVRRLTMRISATIRSVLATMTLIKSTPRLQTL